MFKTTVVSVRALLLLVGVALLLIMPSSPARAQGPPMFTAEFYKTDPSRWLNKEVTVSVAYVKPDDTHPGGGQRVLDALTYYNRHSGGHIELVAPEAVATRLIQLCGTQVRHGIYPHPMQVHGLFQQSADGGFHIYVTK